MIRIRLDRFCFTVEPHFSPETTHGFLGALRADHPWDGTVCVT